MARKVIAEANKKAAVTRIVSGRSTASDEGRRYGVSAQAVRAWVREMGEDIKREQEAESRAKASAAQGGSTPPAPPGTPPPPPPASAGGKADERSDADRRAAALAAAGLPAAPPASPGASAPTPGGSPPAPGASPGAPDISDEAIVEMAGNFIMGLGTRGSLFLASKRAKIKVRMSPDLEALCVLTEKEKAALKPAIPFLAPRIRNFIGSNENVAVGAAVTVVGMGLMDRMSAVGAAVRDAVERAAPPPARSKAA